MASIVLQKDKKSGHPVLPDWDEIEPKDLYYKKLLIGKFMTEMYRASTVLLRSF
jgi:hypothetical protein